MNSNKFAVIMAGGVGSRFWPVSTSEFPKQFHDMLGTGRSLLQQTFIRLRRQVPVENILILTNREYTGLCKEQLPEVLEQNIVAEPAMRNTAPCILLAALKIQKMNPHAVMIVAPSDHHIANDKHFDEDLAAAFKYCSNHTRALLTLGVTPDHPNTGYGYIEYGQEIQQGFHQVRRFREKPKKKIAKEYIKAGNFLWNAGIFIWSVDGVLTAFAKAKQELFNLFLAGVDELNTSNESAFLTDKYPLAEDISIDYAILEDSDEVVVRPVDFGWNDLGTWGSLHKRVAKDEDGNALVNVNSFIEDSNNNLIYSSSGKKVVIKGLDDFIIVDKDDVLLILPMEDDQDIKKLRKKAISSFDSPE
jgi:mannose-1-phosphate guanylyltransferase